VTQKNENLFNLNFSISLLIILFPEDINEQTRTDAINIFKEMALPVKGILTNNKKFFE